MVVLISGNSEVVPFDICIFADTAAELKDQNIIGSTFTIQRGALSATKDFKCWTVDGNDKAFPKTNPPLKVIWLAIVCIPLPLFKQSYHCFCSLAI